jgi:hypothetical protein
MWDLVCRPAESTSALAQKGASKTQQQSAFELMARAITCRGNHAPASLACTELRQYIKSIRDGRCACHTRPMFCSILKDLEASASRLIQNILSSKSYTAVEEDSCPSCNR